MSPLQTPTLPAAAPKKSGPATEAGRRASSRNSFRHGFSGSGKVLSDDLRLEVDTKHDRYIASLRPTDEIEAELVYQMALASVRITRIIQADDAYTGERVRHALQNWDEARAAQIRALADLLDAEPAEAVRLLRLTTHGTDFLADQWDTLKDVLDDQGFWNDAQAIRALRLLGMDNELDDDSTRGLADYWVNLEGARDGDIESRAALARIADQELAELDTLGKFLWATIDEPDRDQAPRRALIDLSAEGRTRARYLADAERLFYRSFNELNRLRARGGTGPRQPSYRPAPPRPAPAVAPARNEPAPAASAPPRPASPPPPPAAPKPAVPPAPVAPRNELVRPIFESLLDIPQATRIDLPMVPNRPPAARGKVS